MGVQVVRVAVGAFAVLLLVSGVGIVAMGGTAAFIGALMVFGSGAVLLVGVAIERLRYRSLAAERGGAPVGPGGGEPLRPPVEDRFRPTAEVFIDPTSGQRMRVLLDPRTGERRYVAEG